MHVPIGVSRCARGAEHLALPGLDDAFEHFAALDMPWGSATRTLGTFVVQLGVEGR